MTFIRAMTIMHFSTCQSGPGSFPVVICFVLHVVQSPQTSSRGPPPPRPIRLLKAKKLTGDGKNDRLFSGANWLTKSFFNEGAIRRLMRMPFFFVIVAFSAVIKIITERRLF